MFGCEWNGGAAFLHSFNLNEKQVERDLRALGEPGPVDWSKNGEDLFLQTWSESEREKGSTWREVRTIVAGLGAFTDKLKNSSVI